jgi:protein-disulfide isomerase
MILRTARRNKRFLQTTTCFTVEQGGVVRKILKPAWVLPALFSVSLLFSSPLLSVTPETLPASSESASTIVPVSAESTNPVQLAAEGLTREQGDAILRELRSIRELLQKQQTAKKPRKRPTSARVSIGDNHSLGQADAPVTMVEFTDYQCPYCKRFHDNTFPKLREKYIDTGKLRYVSMDLPLQFHQQARPAAHAARCAGEQDKFWQMRKSLFDNSRALGKEALVSYAGDLSLDTEAFQACLDDKRHEGGINQNIQIARGAGFTGTPSFVIGKNVNGQVSGAVLIGAKSLAEFENQIQRLLPKVKAGE